MIIITIQNINLPQEGRVCGGGYGVFRGDAGGGSRGIMTIGVRKFEFLEEEEE